MWIFANDAFLSIVAHRHKDMLLVRARKEEDLRNVFPHAQISATPRRDYQFRAVVKRRDVEKAMTRELRRIDYTNFKDSIADPERHDACSAIWSTMWRWANGGFRYKKPLPMPTMPFEPTLDKDDDAHWRTHEQPLSADLGKTGHAG